MKNKFIFSTKLKLISLILILIGIGSFIYGYNNNQDRTWANFLIGNYYFISLVIGASFFAAIQRITQSGWSAMFVRIPEAISNYLPIAIILMLTLIIFGSHHIYHWLNIKNDELLAHKAPYLNFTFFTVRTIIYLLLWIVLTQILRRFSLKEDMFGGNSYFVKSEFYSKIFIFTLAITFSLATFDWLMSIDYHWFSTIFAIKNFVSSFLHGSAVIILFVLLLNKNGYFEKLNQHHKHDFSKYLFMLSIMWGYMWFSQYFLIWFSNIPEETSYYYVRLGKEWNSVFFVNIIINWLFPFLFLMLNKIAKNTYALLFASIVLLIGLWIDLYIQIMPGVIGINSIGFIEIGMFLGFWGIFIFIVFKTLEKVNLIPNNHPFINESFLHKLN